MSAVELNALVVEQLGDGNTVAPREALKQQVADLLDALDRQGEARANLAGEERVATFLDAISDELAGFLAVAAPLIEYAGNHGQEAVIRALAQVTSEISRQPNQENAYYLVTARLLWCTTAFALACDAIDFLPRLLRLTVSSAFRNVDEPLIDDSSARHLEAFARGADVAFNSHREWLASLDLLAERYPLLAREQQLEKALAEADLIFALHTEVAGRGIHGTYSAAAHREGGCRTAAARSRPHARCTRAARALLRDP